MPVRIVGSVSPFATGETWTQGSSGPPAPVATSATNILFTSFSANWNSVTGATSYRLDVATDSGFTSFVTGFNNLNVGNVTTYSVTGLLSAVTYYYRVRAFSTSPSLNSNTISLTTATWPTGVDGDLTVDGITVHLANGVTKDYHNVTVINGGQLIIDQGSDWTILGASGILTIDSGGVIITEANDSAGGTYTKTAPDGQSLSYTVNVPVGGSGGNCYECGTHEGGTENSGNGGGGAANGDGGFADSTHSGAGLDVTNDGGTWPGGPALSLVTNGFGASGNGGTGDGWTGAGGGCDGAGSGGGGATRGYSGGLLYIKASTLTVTNGVYVILADAQAGGDGGGGGGAGNDLSSPGGAGGGGGGGGAGGQGGDIVVRYHTGTFSPLISVAGGPGGIGGTGGPGNIQVNGDDGFPGSNGDDGTTDVATY